MQVIGFDDYRVQARALSNTLAQECHKDYQEISRHTFPDGESLVRVPVDLLEHVVLVRSLDQPNNKLVELLLSVSALRSHGAKRITLVAPYLCYMRQDAENQPGEAVSQQVIGKLLAQNFDDVVTVDPHLHRIQRLDQAIPIRNALVISAGKAIGWFLGKHYETGILVGPDSESEQWVGAIAEKTGFACVVGKKVRMGDKRVDIQIPQREYAGQNAIIIDDITSTGRTIAQTAARLLQAGAKQVDVVVTHPLFCVDAEKFIRQAGVTNVWSTDSISHPTNAISLAGILAEAVKKII